MSVETTHSPGPEVRLLIVAEQPDTSLEQFVAACASAGWVVERAADVYAAMGKLAVAHGGYARVVVDTRTLDAPERRFIELARTYYPAVSVHELSEFLHGGDAARTQEREEEPVAAMRQEIVTEEPIDDAAVAEAEALPGVTEEIPEGLDPIYEDAAEVAEAEPEPVAHVEAEPSAPVGPRLASPPPEEDETGAREQSMHDAVRQRMLAGAGAEGLVRPVRRMPPGTRRATIETTGDGSAAPANGEARAANSGSANAGGRAALTKEEMDALLAEDEPRKGGSS